MLHSGMRRPQKDCNTIDTWHSLRSTLCDFSVHMCVDFRFHNFDRRKYALSDDTLVNVTLFISVGCGAPPFIVTWQEHLAFHIQAS